jgi:hypothetical protein
MQLPSGQGAKLRQETAFKELGSDAARQESR